MSALYRVTFVCMGNICRSPTAHGVFRQRVREAGLSSRVRVDSAGTHDYHPGEPPDPRSQRHAHRRGYDLSDLRARALVPADYQGADLLLAVDEETLETAGRRCPPAHAHKLELLTRYCLVHRCDEVPDPYYGGAADFEHVLDLVEDACDGLLAHVRGVLAARAP
jgi:protein-tyrosine phosphatase